MSKRIPPPWCYYEDSMSSYTPKSFTNCKAKYDAASYQPCVGWDRPRLQLIPHQACFNCLHTLLVCNATVLGNSLVKNNHADLFYTKADSLSNSTFVSSALIELQKPLFSCFVVWFIVHIRKNHWMKRALLDSSRGNGKRVFSCIPCTDRTELKLGSFSVPCKS